MHRRSLIALGLAAGGAAALSQTSALAAAKGRPWTSIFDGTSLDGWSRIGDANWALKDGVVQADKGGGFLMWKDSYRDVQIRAEFWVSHDANSGVFIRCMNPLDVQPTNSYEVNIFDERPDPSYGTGAIVNVGKVSPEPKAGGKWSVMEIMARGDRFDVTFDGRPTVRDAHDSRYPEGHIALQYESPGLVKFRKVQVRPL